MYYGLNICSQEEALKFAASEVTLSNKSSKIMPKKVSKKAESRSNTKSPGKTAKASSQKNKKLPSLIEEGDLF